MIRGTAALVLLALALAPRSAAAEQDDEPFRAPKPFPAETPKPDPLEAPPPGARPEGKSALNADDETVPDPPLVRAQAGAVFWPFLRTRLQIGRHRLAAGTDVQSAEDRLGLPDFGVSPFVDVSVGTTLRVGVYALDLNRRGSVHGADQVLRAEARTLARPGDHVQIRFHYTQAEVYGHWDALVGARYRLGLLGGARIIRIGTRLRGIQTSPIAIDCVATTDNVFSPFFGGHLELEPVSLFTVYTSVRFIDWSWTAIDLKDQRTFEVRLGTRVEIIPDVAGLALDFRFLAMAVDASNLSGGRVRARFELDAGGIGFSATFKY